MTAPLSINLTQVENAFRNYFSDSPSHSYFSPGRVNLIGEHIDYNGGLVMPTAIDLGTYLSARRNSRSLITVYTQSLDQIASVSVPLDAATTAASKWTDYFTGVVLELQELDISGSGFDVFVTGNLPRNSGLSSSASFTVAFAYFLNHVWQGGLSRLDIVALARRVENRFIGLNCGVMDQYAVVMSEKSHCLLLDCDAFESEQIPLSIEAHSIVIADSNVPRKLTESAYNERIQECHRALQALQVIRPIPNLCAASLNDIQQCIPLREMPEAFRRARHAISEHARVKEASHALQSGQLDVFGKLMSESHQSLRDDYEVSCPELDLLVDTACRVDGVLGSRMTGAGFGGCTVSLVANDAIENFSQVIEDAYMSNFGRSPSFSVCQSGGGVRQITAPCNGTSNDPKF